MERQPSCRVFHSQGFDRIRRRRNRWRNLGHEAAVWPPDPKLSIWISMHLEALFVHRPVVPTAQHCEVRQGGRPTLGPVTDVMPLPEAHAAAREAAVAVAMVQRAP